MPAPDLNDPEAQARYEAEQAAAKVEADRRAAEVQKAEDRTNSGAGGLANGIYGAVDDFFSAETVNGPGGGSWGASGTAASGYNAQQAQQGAREQAGAQAQGQQALVGGNTVARGLLGQAGGAANRAAPTTNYAGADHAGSQAESSRNVANGLVNNAGNASQQQQQLQALNNFAAQGPGPSAAQAQLAAGSDAAQLSALSMARSGRGAGESASALRDATFANAQTQGTVGGQAAQLRAAEDANFKQQQLAALNSAMGGAGAIRGADTAAAQVAQGTRAQDLQSQQQAAQQSQFQTSAALQGQGQNDALQTGLTNAALGFNSNANQTNLGFAGLGQQAATDRATLGQNALNAQSDYELQQQQMQLDAAKANQTADLEKDSGISGLLGAAAGVFGLSDERAKKLKHKEASLSAALDTVGNAPGYSYEYKDPKQPGAKPGRQYGPMAQDLEKGPLGHTIVSDTPNGKMVDYGRVAMLGASAITELNHKVAALEKALGKGRAA